MRALYLYFAETARPSGDASPTGIGPAVDEGPLVAIQPGAFSRWKANRDRVVPENAAALRGALGGSAVRRRRGLEPAG
jgi:hypothetical protein